MKRLRLDDRVVEISDAQSGKLLFLGRAVPVTGEPDTIRLAFDFTEHDGIVAGVLREAADASA